MGVEPIPSAPQADVQPLTPRIVWVGRDSNPHLSGYSGEHFQLYYQPKLLLRPPPGYSIKERPFLHIHLYPTVLLVFPSMTARTSELGVLFVLT